MLSRRTFLIVGIVLIIVGVAGYFISTKLGSSKAGLLIQTTPQAMVYVNDEQVGTTPYEAVRPSGEVTVRLVPIATNQSLAPWGTKLSLVEGIQTVIKRDFGETEVTSSGEVLSFEKISGSKSSITVVSSPDASQITFDGEIRGFTPLPLDSINSGQHTILVSQPGYAERTISAKTEPGYKLTVVAMLSQLPKTQEPETAEATESAEVAGTAVEVEKIEILSTEIGYVRVRPEPSTAKAEIGKVTAGKVFELLEKNTDETWYKIEFEKGKEGWISAQYAEKVGN